MDQNTESSVLLNSVHLSDYILSLSIFLSFELLICLGVIVAILVFCALVHLFFSGKRTSWKNSPQKRKQEAVLTARDLISMDISNISALEFRIMIIKIVAGLKKSIEDTRESLSQEIKELKI